MSWADVEIARRVRAPKAADRITLFIGLMCMGATVVLFVTTGDRGVSAVAWIASCAVVVSAF